MSDCCSSDHCCPYNWKRMVIGGLVAGIWGIACMFAAHWLVLGERYVNLAKMGLLFEKPRFASYPFWMVLFCVLVGLGLAWLYAVARNTLKPGPMTALKIGFVVGVIAVLPGNVGALAWSPIGKLVPFVTTIAGFVQFMGGALLAGWIYKPQAQVMAA